MGGDLQPIDADIVTQRVGIQPLAPVNGIARIGGDGSDRQYSNQCHDQHEQASSHLPRASQNAKSSRGPTRKSWYRRDATFEVRTS